MEKYCILLYVMQLLSIIRNKNWYRNIGVHNIVSYCETIFRSIYLYIFAHSECLCSLLLNNKPDQQVLEPLLQDPKSIRNIQEFYRNAEVERKVLPIMCKPSIIQFFSCLIKLHVTSKC